MSSDKDSPLVAAFTNRPNPLFGSIFSRTLPNYNGPYPVGISDIELPVRKQSFGTFTHKNIPSKQAGIAMETVLFSVFYPTEHGEKNKYAGNVVWFPRLRQTVNGFLRMAQRTPNWFLKAAACRYPSGTDILTSYLLPFPRPSCRGSHLRHHFPCNSQRTTPKTGSRL
jgi:platelet-activating factor acetylhydrolase